MKSANYCYAIRWLLLLLSALGGGTAPAHGAEHYHFTTITLKAGLPSTVECICSDSRGYIWTGTRGGLGRFDGHEQYRYTYEQDNPHSLPGGNIYQIAEDSHGTLWVMTDQGVARYDYRHNHFHRLTDTEGEAVVAFAACRYRGGMLFATGHALYRLDEGEQQAVRWHDLQAGKEGLRVVRLCLLPGGQLLLGSRWQGMYLIDLASGQRRAAPYDCGREITDLMLDSRQRLWIATYNEGVRCFTPEGQLLQAYHTGNSALSHNIVLCMTEREGNLWMGTDGGGINILNPEEGTFAHLTHRAGDKKYSLPTNSVNSLYNDPYGNLWIGGVYNGLIGMNRVFMKTYADAYPGSRSGLTHPVVLSLYQQPEGDALYIGTDGGGVNRLNPADETFDSYPATQGMKVASICGFGPRRLLLSSFSQGVFTLDLPTGTLSPFTIIDAETTARLCLHGHAVNLYQSTSRTVLLLSDHVYIYHLDTRRFTLAGEEKNTPISPGSLQAIAATDEATYLCGCPPPLSPQPQVGTAEGHPHLPQRDDHRIGCTRHRRALLAGHQPRTGLLRPGPGLHDTTFHRAVQRDILHCVRPPGPLVDRGRQQPLHLPAPRGTLRDVRRERWRDAQRVSFQAPLDHPRGRCLPGWCAGTAAHRDRPDARRAGRARAAALRHPAERRVDRRPLGQCPP